MRTDVIYQVIFGLCRFLVGHWTEPCEVRWPWITYGCRRPIKVNSWSSRQTLLRDHAVGPVKVLMMTDTVLGNGFLSSFIIMTLLWFYFDITIWFTFLNLSLIWVSLLPGATQFENRYMQWMSALRGQSSAFTTADCLRWTNLQFRCAGLAMCPRWRRRDTEKWAGKTWVRTALELPVQLVPILSGWTQLGLPLWLAQTCCTVTSLP